MTSAAVIGVGYWGRKHVEEYYKLGIDVYATDPVEANREFCKEKGWVKGTYSDIKDVCANDDIKYVSVCTPNHTHYELAKLLLENGKNVLVEKPFVMEGSQGRELIELAREKKLNLSVGHIFRFNNAINFVKNVLEHGDLGTPYLLKLSWTNIEPVYPKRDVIFDLAPHPFDIVDFLFGKNVDEVFCISQKYRQDEVEAAFINSKLNDALINIEVSWVTPKKERNLVLVGSKATAFVECTRQKVTLYENDKNAYHEVDLVPNNTLQDELREFVRCVESRGTSVADAEVGAKIVKVLEAAKLSMEAGKAVKID